MTRLIWLLNLIIGIVSLVLIVNVYAVPNEEMIIEGYAKLQEMRQDDLCLLKAIRKAENGKEHIAFGIMLKHCDTFNKQMRSCYQTILNNRVRFNHVNMPIDYSFISKLGARYCPVNKEVWVKNVWYWFNKYHKLEGEE